MNFTCELLVWCFNKSWHTSWTPTYTFCNCHAETPNCLSCVCVEAAALSQRSPAGTLLRWAALCQQCVCLCEAPAGRWPSQPRRDSTAPRVWACDRHSWFSWVLSSWTSPLNIVGMVQTEPEYSPWFLKSVTLRGVTFTQNEWALPSASLGNLSRAVDYPKSRAESVNIW